jgi:DNA repair exonuclease SbcCD ATPase subunit
MRRKLVLWGTNEKDEKMLVALELLEKENVVNIYTFPENVATEEFYKSMSEKWKDDEEVEFPAGFTKIERKLSVSDSLLPDEIKVEKTDLINRAQAEWHFVVLSSKLYGLYKSELEELKEKIDGLGDYDNGLWNELKDFWSKVQGQVNDKNLFREHGAALREKTNHLFDKLKELKKSLENEFESQSKKYLENFKQELTDIEGKIEKGFGLHPIFEDLKKVQAKVKDFKFTKEDRNELWDKIDATFKNLKEKRGQGGSGNAPSNNNNNLGRLEARMKGLMGAIHKMQVSIDFDQKDLDFQAKKVADSDGQLESQLRAAKIRMIEERLKSKQEKLDDMNLTKAEIESKMEKEKKRAFKVEKQEKLDEAKEVVKQKIADNIAEQNKELDKISDKLEKAASELVKPKKESFMDKLSSSVEQLVEDVVDTAKAVAEVAGEKLDDIMDQVEELADKAEDKFEEYGDKAADKFEDIKNEVADLAEKAEDKFDDLKDKAEDLVDKAADKIEDIKDKVAEKFDAAEGEKLEDKVDASDDETNELKA